MRGEGFSPCTVQGMRERGIFSFSKENSSFFAQVRMSMRHKCRVMRPPFSFPRKKTGVARPKERRFSLQASSSKNCNACPIVLPCARRCRVWCCYTTWPTSTTRCRSAHLVFVQPNHLLSAIHIVLVMRTAASEAMPPWQAIASLCKSEVDGDCVRLTTRRQSDSEDRR